MSSSTRRQQENNTNTHQQEQDQQQQQQYQATIRSIDETKNNIHRAIDEGRKDTPRYAQTITDFQNETAEATREIADNFLESQKEVINSMQSAWGPMMQNIQGAVGGGVGGGTSTMKFFPFSPQQIADIYARTIGAMTEAYVASIRIATNMVFAGLDASRATTNYTRENAKEASRIASNTARAFSQTAKETVQVQGGGQGEQRGGEERSSSGGGSSSSSGGSRGGRAAGGSTSGSLEARGGGAHTTSTTSTVQGTMPASNSGISSTTEMVSLSDTVPSITEKEGKKF